MPLGSVLLSASLIWNGPLRRGLEGKRWWEGSKGSLWGILMSHLGPSLSHLYQCGGCKAPEQVGKPLTLKTPVLSRELWPAVSLKPSLLCLWTKSHWTCTFMLLHVMCVKSCEPKAVECLHTQRNIYIYIFFLPQSLLPPHAGCRALTCVEHLREKSGWSPGHGGSPRRYVHVSALKTGRCNVVKS